MSLSGTGNLFLAAAVVAARPFGIHCKIWRPTGVGQNDPFRLYQTLDDEEYRLRVNNGNVLSQEIAGGVIVATPNGAEAPDSQWCSVTLAFQSGTNRSLFVQGVLFSGPTNTSNPATPTNTLFRPPINGACAELSVWDLTDVDSTELADLDQHLHDGGAGGNGANPIDLTAEASEPWTGRLLAYVRALDLTDICDLSGNGNDFSISGTLSVFGSHPPVDPVPNTCNGIAGGHGPLLADQRNRLVR